MPDSGGFEEAPANQYTWRIVMRGWTSRLALSCGLFLTLFTVDALGQAQFVYTNNDTSPTNTVSGFSIGPSGSLTQIAGSPFATGGNGQLGLFSSNRITSCTVGTFLYVANSGSGNISAFSINPTTGALTPVAGSPFAISGASSLGFGISMAPTLDGKFLIATNGNSTAGSNSITVFSVAANGSLVPIAGSPFPAGGVTGGIKVTPDSRFLAVSLILADQVAMFSISPAGTLTPVPGSPFASVSAGNNLGGLEINRASNLLFGTNLNMTNPGTVDVFSIAGNGALSAIGGSPFVLAGTTNSTATTLSNDQQFLFVSNTDGITISSLSVGLGGVLTPVAGSPFAVPGGFLPTGLAQSFTGGFLYAVDIGDVAQNNEIHAFTINGAGALTPIVGSPFATGQNGVPMGIATFPCALTTGDLAISKSTLSQGPFFVGQNITYTITVTNIGPGFSVAPSFSDTLPAGTSFVSLVAPAGWTSVTPPVGGTGVVQSSTDSLDPGEVAVFTLTLQITSSSSSISNTATVTSRSFDPVSANNSATSTSTGIIFEYCVQDDANGKLIVFNRNGDYVFFDCRKGTSLSGRGTFGEFFCKITLTHSGPTKTPDRNINVVLNPCTKVGTASVKIFSTGANHAINDSNVTNNTCVCP